MSSSYSCECELRGLAQKLISQAQELIDAADTLQVLRESDFHKESIANAKKWAKDWLSR